MRGVGWVAVMALLSCGGGKKATPPVTVPIPEGDNVVEVVSDSGATYLKSGVSIPVGYTNGLFATVTVCEPGGTRCQSIDHVLVDTGSVGLRLLQEVLTVPLPAYKNAAGDPLAECTQFVDGDTWGPLVLADVTLGGEVIRDLVVQTVGTATFQVPSRCTGTPINDIKTLGSNGILGVGLFKQDCGNNCAREAGRQLVGGPAYFACPGTGCTLTAMPLDGQLQNPVSRLGTDNNGVVITMPALAELGAPEARGVMILGVGTRDNNALGAAKILTTDRTGFMNAYYPAAGTNYGGFIDSGSNGNFILDSARSAIPGCTSMYKDFYCPSKTVQLGMALGGMNGVKVDLVVPVGNAGAMFAEYENFAFGNLAGPMPDPTLPGFDLGLSFHFGRTIYVAIEDMDTPGGKGPFFAL